MPALEYNLLYINVSKEVIVINKQKFLAELGKLLTFMNDEDRTRAMAMYSEMFDSFNDESALIKALMSPTRQAILISRSYDRSSSGDSAFIAVIEKVRQDAAASIKIVPAPVSEPEPPVQGPDLEAELEAESRALADEEEAEVTSADAASSDETGTDESALEVSVSEAAPSAAEDSAEPEQEEQSSDIPAEAPDAMPETPADKEAEPTDEVDVIGLITGSKPAAPVPATERRAKVFLLILYTLIAIPFGIVGVCVLLVPSVLTAALTAVSGFSCFALGAAALSGFAVLADFFTVLGLAVITLAVSLLLLWTVIWLLFGAIPGWIRFLCALGSALCFKEVEVDG